MKRWRVIEVSIVYAVDVLTVTIKRLWVEHGAGYKERTYWPTTSSLARLFKIMSSYKLWVLPVETPDWKEYKYDPWEE